MKKYLLALIYIIPAILIAAYFLINNQVLINLNFDQKNVNFTINNKTQECLELNCEVLIPRNLKTIAFEKEGFVSGNIPINTYKSQEYTVELLKKFSLISVENVTFEEPFILKNSENKIILYTNFGTLFPVASFPNLDLNSSIFYSSDLNYVLLVDSKTNNKYLLDIKNNKKSQLDINSTGSEYKVFNNGDVAYKNTNLIYERVNQKLENVLFYNVDSLDYIFELDDEKLLVISKSIDNIFVDENGINFTFEVLQSLSSTDNEFANYKLYISDKNTSFKQLFDLKDYQYPFKLIKNYKGEYKIYLQSSNDLFEISL